MVDESICCVGGSLEERPGPVNKVPTGNIVWGHLSKQPALCRLISCLCGL